MLEPERDLRCGGGCGNRQRRAPGVYGSKPCGHEVETVGGTDGDPIARTETLAQQARCDSAGLTIDLTVADGQIAAPGIDDSRPIGVSLRPVVQDAPNVDVHSMNVAWRRSLDGGAPRVTMRRMPSAQAVRIREPGGPEVLEVGEIEISNPGPSQVLVEVAAAGLNRADCLQRRGFYPAPPGVPADVPGLELAGVVHSVGDAVSEWQPGDRVMGILGGGAMATLALTEAAELMPIPDGMSLTDAAAVPEVFLTAYDAIVLQGGLKAGQTVLLHDAVH